MGKCLPATWENQVQSLGCENPLKKEMQPTPVLLPGKFHGWRSLVGYRLWDHKESERTERHHFHYSLSCIRKGNGNPLQFSCLENPRDGGACWAGVYGIAQSQTRLERLSSSSSSTSLLSDRIGCSRLLLYISCSIESANSPRGYHF